MTAKAGRLSAVQEDLLRLVQDIPREQMQQYVDRYIGSLLTVEGYDPELLQTLETYAICNGHINEMSSRLYIHRNTAAYRLEKLERLIGIPLKETENLLLLNLVFLFRRLLDAEKANASANGLLTLDYRSHYRTS
ncbi:MULTISPECIES: PucR family transcriptional regulator [Paenibacillus]|uniref:PucR family transcriptional regulator n=1 Tax=Paenibacillus illinoisensis TaxID=59845 RepID=A0A2W0C094_9BACL|nr:helix-turn-helix domain-containing protein [Paenibacillus illinoisensis]PYY25064.1 PucR family transcriptional regulator [Paenibacillus illinoisensis]